MLRFIVFGPNGLQLEDKVLIELFGNDFPVKYQRITTTIINIIGLMVLSIKQCQLFKQCSTRETMLQTIKC